MIKKLICSIWGHKTIHKAYTGEKISVLGMLGYRYDIALYRFKKTDFCTRCGETVCTDNLIDQPLKDVSGDAGR